MKKALVVLVCLALMINIFSVSALAETPETRASGTLNEINYESYGAMQTLDRITDLAGLEETLFNGFYNCQATVDISSFNISETDTNLDALSELIFNEMPENFHIASFYYWRSYGKITKIEPIYEMSKSVYQSKYREFIVAKDELLDGIENNYYLTDVQKALLIHDRLALVCEYDYNEGEYRYDSYGAMVVGSAVCQGYTEAYDYLLEEVGIESYTCSSDTLNHIWNIIYINNRPYHVDVTWDDYAWDEGERGAVGVVGHENFLRSSDGIYSTGHTAYDYDTFPTSTTYDNYFWQRSESAFQLIDNELYYVDNVSGSIKRYSDRAELYTLTAEWESPNGRTWNNQSRLASDKDYLYCSLSQSVHRLSVSETSHSQIYAPSLSSGESIYGFEYSNGYLVCDINTAPPYYASMSSLRQQKYAYNPQNTNTTATLSVNSSYNASITSAGQIKYYTFTPSTSGKYVIYSTSDDDTKTYLYDSNGIQLYYDDDGGEGNNFRLEYELTAGRQYTFGVQYYSSSKTGTIPFKFGKVYTITYSANGGSGAPSTQYKDYGKSITLSSTIPVRNNYTFKGWATSSTATTATYQPEGTYSAENNITLYAVWGAESTVLTTNSSNSAPILSGGQIKYYTFTPSTSGKYVIYSTSTEDTLVYLYNSSGTQLDYDDDDGENTNFRLEYELTAGRQYKFGLKYYNSSITGTIPFKFGRVYTITYNANGGSGAPSTQYKDYGKSITLSDIAPAKSNYSFKGWATSSTATTAAYQPAETYSAENHVTLYAVWESALIPLSANSSNNATISNNGQTKYYTFTPSTSGKYVIYSTSNDDTKVYLYNSSGTLLNYDDDSGEGNNFRLEYELIAGRQYKFGMEYYSYSTTGIIPFKFGRVYTITYNANGGSGAPSIQYKDYGKNITLNRIAPTKSGYTFEGWATSSTATTAAYQPNDTYNTERDITLYAIWKSAHVHTYRNYTTPATTSANGKIVKKCTACGYIASQSTVRKIKTISLSGTSYSYNGKVKTPGVIVKNSAGTVISSNQYTVTYQKGRKNVGQYKVTIRFKGYYSGTRNLYFNIIPPKTAISKLTAGKKSFTAKITKKASQVTGYQIQYATYRNFKNPKSKTIGSYKTTSYTLKNLTAKKTYYVRVRTYKKVGSKIYYSPWSVCKTIKTK